MLNEAMGSLIETSAGRSIRTRPQVRGHAIYGPYQQLTAGRYEVTFHIRLADAIPAGQDPLCALIDVALAGGSRSPAFDFVFASQLGDCFTPVTLAFELDHPEVAEFRVFTAGTIAIEVLDCPVLAPTSGGAAKRRPPSAVPLLVNRPAVVRQLYENGIALALADGGMRATADGVTFHANRYDYVNFVDELFWKQAYNFVAGADVCVVDVGMNVGLAALLFAAKPGVREVHAFEPFPETYARGLANLALNPSLAERIAAHNCGLGEGDEEATFLVAATGGDSGAQATLNVEGGRPVRMRIRDAADMLAPILRQARERERRRVVKIDCEGAEFAIFRSLTRAALWSEIDLLMVEWHRVFAGRTQEELLAPLLDAGFVALDLTPPANNGFFYAFRPA